MGAVASRGLVKVQVREPGRLRSYKIRYGSAWGVGFRE